MRTLAGLLLTSVLVATGVAQNPNATTSATTSQATTSTQINSSTQTTVAPPTSPNEQAVDQNLKDVHFDFDRADLTDQDRQVLQEDANWLKANPNVNVSIAGDADERGEIVYNVVLSQERASVTRDALIQLGVPADRIQFATGWGKLYPVCNQSDESCWSQNRRAHFSAGTDLQNQQVAQKPAPLPIIACAAPECR